MLPSLVVPSLVSPVTNIVSACVQAGEEHRDGQRLAGSRKSSVISRPHTAAVKTTANRKLNDRCRLAAELLVI